MRQVRTVFRGRARRRRVAVFCSVLAAAAGLGVLFAAPAFADATILGGSSTCDVDGQYVITWTLHNDFTEALDIELSPVVYQGSTYPASGVSQGSLTFASLSLTEDGTAGDHTTATTVVGGSATGVTLTVTARWHDGFVGTSQFTVSLSGHCTGQATTTTTTTTATTTSTTPDAPTTTTEVSPVTLGVPTTSTSEPNATTTDAPSTSTSLKGSTNATVEGSTAPSTDAPAPPATSTSSSLPFTGSNGATALLGLGVLGLGGLALAIGERRRRTGR